MMAWFVMHTEGLKRFEADIVAFLKKQRDPVNLGIIGNQVRLSYLC